jgi:hypothetical protein
MEPLPQNGVERIMKTIIPLCAVALLATTAHARVKLVALPERARVVVSLTNPEATLVEEERIITLQKGVNQVDFSWQAVNIDPTSIQVRMLKEPGKVVVLNTSYPPNETALIWEINSPEAQEERVRISYLLQGISRDIVYKAVTEPDEKTLALRNYLRLRNDSGEDFTDAEIRIGYGADFTRGIENGEVLELLSERLDNVPLRKELRWDAAIQPWDPEYQKQTIGLPLSYMIKNDTTSKLGAHTFLPGKARLFIKTGATGDGVAFTGEDWVELTPVDRDLRLSIGQSRDVKVTQRKMKDEKTNIHRNTWNQNVLWDTDEEYKIEIENFKKMPADLIVVEHIPGYWKMAKTSETYDRKDAFTIEYHLTLPQESKKTITFALNRLNVQGDNEPRSY